MHHKKYHHIHVAPTHVWRHIMARVRSDEQIVDLLVMGLSWVQARAAGFTGWTANGILGTMFKTGAISQEQYFYILQNAPVSLRNLTVSVSAFGWTQPTTGGPRQRIDTRALVCTPGKWLVVIVNKPVFYNDLLFGSRGYRLLPTQEGRAHAKQVASGYAEVVTEDHFIGQWGSHTRQ